MPLNLNFPSLSPLGALEGLQDGINNILAGLQLSTVTLTAAELIATETTPFQLVAAPGALKAIMPIAIFYQLIFGTTPYNDSLSQQVDVEYGTTGFPINMGPDPGDSIGFFIQTESVWRQILNNAFQTQVLPTSAQINNVPLNLFNFGGSLAGGDGDLQVTVLYCIVPVTL